jgi:hypothetical protein
MSKELKRRKVRKEEAIKEEVRKDVFDLADWLSEHNLSQGEDWEPYRGRKEYCDVRLKDGKEIGPCWPTNGDFIDLTDDVERAISHKDVVCVRYYDALPANEPIIEDEDDEDEEVVGGVWKEPNPDPDDDM